MRALWCFVLGVALAAATPVTAQSAAFMDQVLGQERLAYGAASYLVLAGAGRIADSDSVERALAVMAEKGWALAGRGPEDPVNLGEYAWMLMRAFEIPGGLMYRLAPGPRYATRELAYRGMIQGKARPASALSGERAARILGRVLDAREKQEAPR